MPLPASFAKDGFPTILKARRMGAYRRLMIRTEGGANSGKTEFLMSCPGPGVIAALDRGYDGMLDNPNPPESRRDDFSIVPVSIPILGSTDQGGYLKGYNDFRAIVDKALNNPDVHTFGIDADNLSWNCQRLAEFNKLAGVWPVTNYGPVKSARMALYFRMFESSKIIVSTNWVQDEWVDVVDDAGKVVMERGGNGPKRTKSGGQVSTGFDDHEYLWAISLRHLYKPPVWNKILKKNTSPQWGIRIMRCKANRELEGEELWGSECCFRGLVETVYPQVDISEWGL